jgi:hypothetical protein
MQLNFASLFVWIFTLQHNRPNGILRLPRTNCCFTTFADVYIAESITMNIYMSGNDALRCGWCVHEKRLVRDSNKAIELFQRRKKTTI